MHRYWAYELAIASEIELPGLPPCAPDAPVDVEVVRRELAPAEMASSPDGRSIGAYFHDIARFRIEDGRRITVDVTKEVDEEVVSSRVLGEIFAVLLRQRGLLVVHACSVERDGLAIAFVGESGWGKSTLAEAFRQRGYTLITDDVMGIALEGDRPIVVPSYPQIRLRDDSAEFLAPDGEGLERISRNGPKMAREGIDIANPSCPLVALYFLEPTFREETSIRALPRQEAVMHLIVHTRARTLIQTNTPTLLAQHLDQCSALVQAVEPRVLHRRRSFAALPEIMEAVEADVWKSA